MQKAHAIALKFWEVLGRDRHKLREKNIWQYFSMTKVSRHVWGRKNIRIYLALQTEYYCDIFFAQKIWKMAAFKSQVVSSLVNNCLENISKTLTLHEDLFDVLPHDVKSKLIKKLAMRGLLRDYHLQKVCQPQIFKYSVSSLFTFCLDCFNHYSYKKWSSNCDYQNNEIMLIFFILCSTLVFVTYFT